MDRNSNRNRSCDSVLVGKHDLLRTHKYSNPIKNGRFDELGGLVYLIHTEHATAHRVLRRCCVLVQASNNAEPQPRYSLYGMHKESHGISTGVHGIASLTCDMLPKHITGSHWTFVQSATGIHRLKNSHLLMEDGDVLPLLNKGARAELRPSCVRPGTQSP